MLPLTFHITSRVLMTVIEAAAIPFPKAWKAGFTPDSVNVAADFTSAVDFVDLELGKDGGREVRRYIHRAALFE